VPVEILGTFVKPFALAMRLFANMTGGHVVVAVMLMFVKMMVDGGMKFGGIGSVLGIAGSIVPILAAIGIYFLEVLVSFVQAFVFTLLTATFLGQLIVHDHDHAHDDHGHEGHAKEAHGH
jgi:F-type H+-transporting ATPase subunit a